jgi:hypothetical protein
MPNFDSLREKDVQVIVEYLQSMAGHKRPGAVCPPAAPIQNSIR